MDKNLWLKSNNQRKPAVPKSNKSNSSNSNSNNNKRAKPNKQDLWAWKKVPPTDGKAHQKQVKHPKSDGCKKAKQQQQARATSQPSSGQGTL
eukprot:13935767-Ditylum_brightwellii.AAC.1